MNLLDKLLNKVKNNKTNLKIYHIILIILRFVIYVSFGYCYGYEMIFFMAAYCIFEWIWCIFELEIYKDNKRM